MKPALLAEEISGYFYHLHQCTCTRCGRKHRFKGISVSYSLREAALFLSKSPRNKTVALPFASEYEGKWAEMSGKWWRLNANALIMGKSSGCIITTCTARHLCIVKWWACLNRKWLCMRVCVCVLTHVDWRMSGPSSVCGHSSQTYYDVLFYIFMKGTGTQVMRLSLNVSPERQPLCVHPASPRRYCGWYSRQTNISCLWSRKNRANRLVKIKKGFQFLPNLPTISREGQGYSDVETGWREKNSGKSSIFFQNSSHRVLFFIFKMCFQFFCNHVRLYLFIYYVKQVERERGNRLCAL